MPERRAPVIWAVSPQEGDAAEAIAEIDAWNARRKPAPDWEGILGRLREALEALCAPSRLRDDLEGRRLLQALADTETPEALDAALDRLLARAEVVQARRDVSHSPVPPRVVRLHDLLPRDDLQPGGRTFLRL